MKFVSVLLVAVLGIATVQAEFGQERFAACVERYLMNGNHLDSNFTGSFDSVEISESECTEALDIFRTTFFTSLKKRLASSPDTLDITDCIVEQFRDKKAFETALKAGAYVRAKNSDGLPKRRESTRELFKVTADAVIHCKLQTMETEVTNFIGID